MAGGVAPEAFPSAVGHRSFLAEGNASGAKSCRYHDTAWHADASYHGSGTPCGAMPACTLSCIGQQSPLWSPAVNACIYVLAILLSYGLAGLLGSYEPLCCRWG